MNKDLVSIIVPTYNVGTYLNECVESLLNQTHSNIEILIYNDGSTDNTNNVLKQLVRNKKVKVFSSDYNKGVSAARNFLFREAQGKYIMLQDSDDRSLKTRAESSLRYLKDNSQFKFVSCNIQTSAKNIFKYSEKDEIFCLLKQFLCHKPLGGASSFFSRDVLDAGIKYDENLLAGEDVLFDVEVQSKFPLQMRGLPIITPLYWYRKREESLTSIRNMSNLTPAKVMERRNKKIKRLLSKVLLKYRDEIESYFIKNPNLRFKEISDFYKENDNGSKTE